MTQGTTPTIELQLSNQMIDLTTAQKVRATLMQGDKVLSIESPDARMRLEMGKVLLDLTQQDTLFFVPGRVQVQLRWMDEGGKVCASTIGILNVDRILEKEVMW